MGMSGIVRGHTAGGTCEPPWSELKPSSFLRRLDSPIDWGDYDAYYDNPQDCEFDDAAG